MSKEAALIGCFLFYTALGVIKAKERKEPKEEY